MYQINSKPAYGHTRIEAHSTPISILKMKPNFQKPSISKKCIKLNRNQQINSPKSFKMENFIQGEVGSLKYQREREGS